MIETRLELRLAELLLAECVLRDVGAFVSAHLHFYHGTMYLKRKQKHQMHLDTHRQSNRKRCR